MGVQTIGMNHITLRVPDIDRSVAFFRDVLGFDVQRPDEGLAMFFTGQTLIAIRSPLPGTPEGDRFSEYRVGVDHLAMTVPNEDELKKLVESLTEAGVETAGVETDDLTGKQYVAFRDPDNIQWECFLPLQ
jgi:catechol 2,3-dioxygenase-like lactoylglutathione lyase family enzyme